MIKTYITGISQHTRTELLQLWYQPDGFELEHNRKTSFPIIPVIAEQYQPGDDVKIIAIRPDNLDTPDNYQLFLKELYTLGISETEVTEISVIENQGEQGSIRLLLKILDEIPDDSLVSADITFGTKPMSAMLLYAMSFVEKLKDSEVQGIYYGEIPRVHGKAVPEQAMLHDLTAFKRLVDVIESLKKLEIQDISQALHAITEM